MSADVVCISKTTEKSSFLCKSSLVVHYIICCIWCTVSGQWTLRPNIEYIDFYINFTIVNLYYCRQLCRWADAIIWVSYARGDGYGHKNPDLSENSVYCVLFVFLELVYKIKWRQNNKTNE